MQYLSDIDTLIYLSYEGEINLLMEITFDQFFIKKIKNYHPMINEKYTKMFRRILAIIIILLLLLMLFVFVNSKKTKKEPESSYSISNQKELNSNEAVSDRDLDFDSKISNFNLIVSKAKNEREKLKNDELIKYQMEASNIEKEELPSDEAIADINSPLNHDKNFLKNQRTQNPKKSASIDKNNNKSKKSTNLNQITIDPSIQKQIHEYRVKADELKNSKESKNLNSGSNRFISSLRRTDNNSNNTVINFGGHEKSSRRPDSSKIVENLEVVKNNNTDSDDIETIKPVMKQEHYPQTNFVPMSPIKFKGQQDETKKQYEVLKLKDSEEEENVDDTSRKNNSILSASKKQPFSNLNQLETEHSIRKIEIPKMKASKFEMPSSYIPKSFEKDVDHPLKPLNILSNESSKRFEIDVNSKYYDGRRNQAEYPSINPAVYPLPRPNEANNYSPHINHTIPDNIKQHSIGPLASNNNNNSEMDRKLEFIEKNFTFERFLRNPVECIKDLEKHNIFQVSTIPKTIQLYLEERKNQNSKGLSGIIRNMKVCDLSGNRYDQKNVEKSFNSWRETIRRSIKQNIGYIKPTSSSGSNSISKEILGAHLYNYIFDSNANNINADPLKEQKNHVTTNNSEYSVTRNSHIN